MGSFNGGEGLHRGVRRWHRLDLCLSMAAGFGVVARLSHGSGKDWFERRECGERSITLIKWMRL